MKNLFKLGIVISFLCFTQLYSNNISVISANSLDTRTERLRERTTNLYSLDQNINPEDTQVLNQRSVTEEKVTEKRDEIQNNIKEQKSNNLTKACELRISSLNKVKEESTLAFSKNQEINKRILTKLDNISEYLTSENIDKTTLDSYIDQFSSKIDQNLITYNEYTLLLDNLINTNCEELSTTFRSDVLAMRNKRLKLRQEIVDIKEYLRNTIVPYIKTINS